MSQEAGELCFTDSASNFCNPELPSFLLCLCFSLYGWGFFLLFFMNLSVWKECRFRYGGTGDNICSATDSRGTPLSAKMVVRTETWN